MFCGGLSKTRASIFATSTRRSIRGRNYNQVYNNIGTEDRAQAQAFMDTQIVTVQQILDGARMNLPLMEEVTKKAKRNISDGSDAAQRLIPEY